MTCVIYRRRCFLSCFFSQWKSWLVGFEHEILRQDAAAKLLQSVQVGIISHGQMRSRFERMCWKGMEWYILCIEWSRTYKNSVCIYYIYSIQQRKTKQQGKKVAHVLTRCLRYHVGWSWICRCLLGGNHEHTRISAPERGAIVQQQGIILPRFL